MMTHGGLMYPTLWGVKWVHRPGWSEGPKKGSKSASKMAQNGVILDTPKMTFLAHFLAMFRDSLRGHLAQNGPKPCQKVVQKGGPK